MIKENPAVFEHWDTPLEITGNVDCRNSPITHLSSHLTFSEPNKEGYSANFWDCRNLKTATGTFHGAVSFANAGIQKIENLHVMQTNKDGLSASFWACKDLEIATGSYAGYVNFLSSGIHTIKNLNVKNTKEQAYANFENCPNLHTLENWDLSKTILIEPEKLEAEKKRRAKLQKHLKETQAQELPFL
jgi:hypothetical protein